MTCIRTWNAIAVGTIGGTLYNLNEQRGGEGELCLTSDYAALEEKLTALLDHPAMKAYTDALREAQITGLAFIRVNANGHVQALPSDRVRISVIQAVEERTAAAAHQECDHDYQSEFNGVGYDDICSKCGDTRPEECGDVTPPAPCDHEFSVNDHRDKCLYCGAKLK